MAVRKDFPLSAFRFCNFRFRFLVSPHIPPRGPDRDRWHAQREFFAVPLFRLVHKPEPARHRRIRPGHFPPLAVGLGQLQPPLALRQFFVDGLDQLKRFLRLPAPLHKRIHHRRQHQCRAAFPRLHGRSQQYPQRIRTNFHLPLRAVPARAAPVFLPVAFKGGHRVDFLGRAEMHSQRPLVRQRFRIHSRRVPDPPGQGFGQRIPPQFPAHHRVLGRPDHRRKLPLRPAQQLS